MKRKCMVVMIAFLFALCGACGKTTADNEEVVYTGEDETLEEVINSAIFETESSVIEEIVESEEFVLTEEISERNKVYRNFLETEPFCVSGYFYGANLFNVVDINGDGVPELICNTNDETMDGANVVEVWNGEYFMGGFESMTYCTMTYSPSKGIFIVYDYNAGPVLDSVERIFVYEIDVNSDYGVVQKDFLSMEVQEGITTYFNGGEVISESEYKEILSIYNEDEIPLNTPYEITEENLDMLLPVLD